MSTHQSTKEIITSVLALSVEERQEVVGAIQLSLVEDDSKESAADVKAAWEEELEHRINDVQNGRIKTVPATEAERMIRDDASPAV